LIGLATKTRSARRAILSSVTATYLEIECEHQIVSAAVIVAVGVITEGRREMLGITIGHSETEPSWVEFLCSPTWQRRHVHFVRDAIAHADQTQRDSSPHRSARRRLRTMPPQPDNNGDISPMSSAQECPGLRLC
jgi:transposase-like protein